MDLKKHPLVMHAVETCSACPVQWEGFLHDGRAFYFRYRFGKASIAIGNSMTDIAGEMDVVVFHGDNMQGAFKTETDMHSVFSELLISYQH